MTALHPYQIEQSAQLEQLVRRHRSAANLSDMGTGKTLVACDLVRRLGDPATLVVCPLAAIPTWERWSEDLGVELDVINYDRLRRGTTPFGRWETQQNGPRRTSRFQFAPGVKFLIYDEAHRCKGQSTKQSKTLKAAYRQQIPTLLQTGTLAESPLDLSVTGLHLGLYGGDFWSWAQRNGCWRSPWGGLKFTANENTGRGIMLRLHEKIMERSVRIRRDEIPGFPKTQIEACLIRLTDPLKVNRIYAQMAEALQRLNTRAQSDTDPDHPLTIILRARQALELLRVPAMVEMAFDAIAQGMSVCLFFNFSASIDETAAQFGDAVRFVRIEGGQNLAQRRNAEAAFQADAVRAALINTEAGGVCLSLHDVRGQFPRMSLLSPGWSGMSMQQAFARVNRDGGLTKSLQRVIFIANSQESEVAAAFTTKITRNEVLQNGDLVPSSLRNLV